MIFKTATIEDIDFLVDIRAEVLQDVFSKELAEASDPDALMSRLREANRSNYEKKLKDGSHIAILAYDNSDNSNVVSEERDIQFAGCGGICFDDELPSPDNPVGKFGIIDNIYVREAYRKQGVARQVMQALIFAAKKHGCGRVVLEATDAGRHLYETLGFKPSDEAMILTIAQRG